MDDDFEDIENVVRQQKEIEELRKLNIEQEEQIKVLEKTVPIPEIPESRTKPPVIKLTLPKRYQQILFQVDGKQMAGKVMTRHKNSSSFRNIIGIKLEQRRSMTLLKRI